MGGVYGVVEEDDTIDMLNISAMKYECLFNNEFVASSNCAELEILSELLLNSPAPK